MSYERRIYQHIIPALGNIQLDKLTTNDLQQFYIDLKQNGRLIRADIYGEGLSDQTARGIHTTLHAALDKAVAEKLIFRNPADGCHLPSAKAREMQVLTPEEIQRLLIQAKEDGCYELLLLEFSTGLRRGEICALQWHDLNLRTGELWIERQVHRAKTSGIFPGVDIKKNSNAGNLASGLLELYLRWRRLRTSPVAIPARFSPRKAVFWAGNRDFTAGASPPSTGVVASPVEFPCPLRAMTASQGVPWEIAVWAAVATVTIAVAAAAICCWLCWLYKFVSFVN